MVYWKSLEQRSLEAATLCDGRYLSTASSILGPVQLSRLISWLAAHDLLADVDSDQYQSAVQGALCEEVRALELDLTTVNGEFLVEMAERCGPALELLKLGCAFKGETSLTV